MLRLFSPEATEFAGQILIDLQLTFNWQARNGPIINQAFVDEQDVISEREVDLSRLHILIFQMAATGRLRDPWNHYGLPLPYGPGERYLVPGRQVLWAEYNLVKNIGPSPPNLHHSLFQFLGDDLLSVAIDDTNYCTQRLIPNKDADIARAPVDQVTELVNAAGYDRNEFKNCGLVINGEDDAHQEKAATSIVSGYLARYKLKMTMQQKTVITFVAGRHVSRPASDRLSGVSGMLRCLIVQLIYRYRPRLRLGYINDQYLCQIFHGEFVALLYLFKHLIHSIAWEGCQCGLHHIALLIDGIHVFERAEHKQHWSNFVLILREIVHRINTIPDADSAYLRTGLIFHYVLIHPKTAPLLPHTTEHVINRVTDSAAPQTSQTSTLVERSRTPEQGDPN